MAYKKEAINIQKHLNESLLEMYKVLFIYTLLAVHYPLSKH